MDRRDRGELALRSHRRVLKSSVLKSLERVFPSGRLLRRAIAVAVALAGGYLIWRESDDLASAVRRLSIGRVLLSGLAAVIGTYLIERVWLSLLGGLGVRTAPREAAGVFFISQLGKYLPGSVWPVLAQMRFGRRWGVPQRVSLAANVLLLGMVTASGIGVGAILLPWSSPGGLTRYWWLLALLVPLLVGLHPRTVPCALDRLLGCLGREPLGIRVSGRRLAAALGWAAVAWVALGAHLAILMTAYDDLGPSDLAAATGGIALAWAAGVAFIPAPAGAGVRETVLVLTLGPLLGTAPALTLALASRVLLVVADVVLAGMGVVWQRGVGPGSAGFPGAGGNLQQQPLTSSQAPRSAPDTAASGSAPKRSARASRKRR